MNIKSLKLLLTKSAKEIFGDNPDETFRELSLVCHPDRTADPEAKDLFQALQSKFDSLRVKAEIKTKKRNYSVGAHDFDGDISSLFISGNSLLKISKSPKLNSFIENEQKILKAIYPDKDSTFFKYLPLIEDTASIKADSNRSCTIFEYDNEYSCLLNVWEDYDEALHPKHVGWMIKRLLVILGYLHKQGYVHGAVLPTHFLINKKNHGGKLIGFGQSVKIGETVKIVSSKWRSNYAPEILEKKPVKPETDIYMLGKTGIMLLGNEIPGQMESFFKGLCLRNPSARPDDAWSLHEEFDDVLTKMFGKRTFHEIK